MSDTARPLRELRGASGRLHARLDPERLAIEFYDRGTKTWEWIDLRPYLADYRQPDQAEPPTPPNRSE